MGDNTPALGFCNELEVYKRRLSVETTDYAPPSPCSETLATNCAPDIARTDQYEA